MSKVNSVVGMFEVGRKSQRVKVTILISSSTSLVSKKIVGKQLKKKVKLLMNLLEVVFVIFNISTCAMPTNVPLCGFLFTINQRFHTILV